MEYKQKVLNRLHEHQLEAIQLLQEEENLHVGVDYTIEGIYLQGSQNYNTHHEGSDVDSKLAVSPTVRSLLLNTSLNHELVLGNGEHVAVKPTTNFVDLFFKGNINNMEILTTEYAIEDKGSFFHWMRQENHIDAISEIVARTIWDASIGMMIQKEKSLFKGTVTTKPAVDKFGYDPKDMVHIVRIHDLLLNLKQGVPFKYALDFSESDDMNIVPAIRNGEWTPDTASVMAKMYIDSAKSLMKEFNPQNHPDVEGMRDIVKKSYVKYYMDRFQ